MESKLLCFLKIFVSNKNNIEVIPSKCDEMQNGSIIE